MFFIHLLFFSFILRVIGNPKDLITVPIDSANNLKEFCSLSCLSIYKSRVEGLTDEDAVVRCSVCRNPSEVSFRGNSVEKYINMISNLSMLQNV